MVSGGGINCLSCYPRKVNMLRQIFEVGVDCKILSLVLQSFKYNCCLPGKRIVRLERKCYVYSAVDLICSEFFLRGDFMPFRVFDSFAGFLVDKAPLYNIFISNDQVFIRHIVEDRDLSSCKGILGTGCLITGLCYHTGRIRSIRYLKAARRRSLPLYIDKSYISLS